ncbi:sensor domain-containing diguanylate cyclase [Pontibacterium granulatum]|uniref:sensor domain-containing diguanylate cyclase n=1 Tax=Pontibacterium granulatum TaxID=2036029 RepID=UPI00249A51E9|nr:sensor domain-containing diguanylate cyclase [Pontibacterium granulatum]MDI3326747.1 sensor domain-containing diguanylate cyclase [Pontibacterium granulatum]
MIDTQQCLSRHPIESIDLAKWQRTVDLMSKLYNAACGTIVQFRQDEFNAIVTSSNEDNFLERNSSWPWEMRSFCRKIMESRNGLYVNDAINHEEWKTVEPVCDGPVRSYLGLPLFWPDDTLFGTICVIDSHSTDYQPLQIELLEQLRDLINADLKMVFAYDEIKTLALTDELTGVCNRRGLQLLSDQLVKDAKRFDLNFGFIYLDIDNMKELNDTHGHSAGDECIVALADALKYACRENDIIARIGGDEFVVLLTCADNNVELVCERIETEYNRIRSDNELLSDNPISFGHIYRSGLHPIALDQMIEEADKLMYKKKHGRKVGEFEEPVAE